jgi:hypothetical protein
MEDLIKKAGGGQIRWDYELKKFKMQLHDLDLNDWHSRCMVLEYWPYSHEMLYMVSSVRTSFPHIRTRVVHGQHFFCVSDIKRYLAIDNPKEV